MSFVTVATVQDIPPGRARVVTAQGWKIALFNVNGTFHAIDDVCPHKGASLAEGPAAGTDVICPWHAARFDLCSGASLTPIARRGVRVFKVQIAGDDIQIELP
jgi:nitrite reductase/ring-hydroxylating ferredoxin subunit